MAENTMDVVQRALAAAAARAKRLADLNAAVTQMEQLMNVPITPEMLPWGAAMLRQVQVLVINRCWLDDAHGVSTASLNAT